MKYGEAALTSETQLLIAPEGIEIMALAGVLRRGEALNRTRRN